MDDLGNHTHTDNFRITSNGRLSVHRNFVRLNCNYRAESLVHVIDQNDQTDQIPFESNGIYGEMVIVSIYNDAPLTRMHLKSNSTAACCSYAVRLLRFICFHDIEFYEIRKVPPDGMIDTIRRTRNIV